jgi:heme/copper-type cytochrome/quinol oxidase subunit 3
MRQPARLGMALFLLNEAVFFFMLIAAFVYFRQASLPAAAASLKPGVTAIYTVCLLASSFTMWRATAIGSMMWTYATLILGGIFLLGQGNEYFRLFRQNVTISQGLFGSTFFTLTGLHGFHVLIGLLLLGVMIAAGEGRSARAGAIALYWHFVDGVWVVIFSVVYLWTFL